MYTSLLLLYLLFSEIQHLADEWSVNYVYSVCVCVCVRAPHIYICLADGQLVVTIQIKERLK